MKKGLVLEGGAMRGMFTAGVTDVFMEKGIKFDGIIGVSAGAVFGCNYKSHQPGRTIRYNSKYCNDPRYVSIRSLIFTGDIYNKKFAYTDIPDTLDPFDAKTFSSDPTEFYVVCTDVLTGRPVYKKLEKGDKEDIEWMRASASMPLASRVVKIGENRLLDGGIADSIPLRYFESIGYEKNIVILTQPADYVKHKNKLIPVMKVALGKYPHLVNAMAQRHDVYNETTAYINEQQKKGSVLIIQPDKPLNIGAVEHDAAELKRVYEIGIETGKRCAEAAQRFLSE